MSLSVRRAWIEIEKFEGVIATKESLSVRRAWIEIILPPVDTTSVSVALRKESVDRNFPTLEGRKKLKCRSP